MPTKMYSATGSFDFQDCILYLITGSSEAVTFRNTLLLLTIIFSFFGVTLQTEKEMLLAFLHQKWRDTDHRTCHNIQLHHK